MLELKVNNLYAGAYKNLTQAMYELEEYIDIDKDVKRQLKKQFKMCGKCNISVGNDEFIIKK